MTTSDLVPVSILAISSIGASIATIATLRQQAKEQNTRHKELREVVVHMAKALEGMRTVSATMQTEVKNFRDLEEERHKNTDDTLDEIKKDIKSVNTTVRSLQLWQAEASGKLKMKASGPQIDS